VPAEDSTNTGFQCQRNFPLTAESIRGPVSPSQKASRGSFLVEAPGLVEKFWSSRSRSRSFRGRELQPVPLAGNSGRWPAGGQWRPLVGHWWARRSAARPACYPTPLGGAGCLVCPSVWYRRGPAAQRIVRAGRCRLEATVTHGADAPPESVFSRKCPPSRFRLFQNRLFWGSVSSRKRPPSQT
jgi:hypothetical protein